MAHLLVAALARARCSFPYVTSRVIVLGALVVTRHVLTTLHVASDLPRRRRACSAWDAALVPRHRARAGTAASRAKACGSSRCSRCSARVVSWLPGVDAGLAVVLVANVAALALGFALYALVLARAATIRTSRAARCGSSYLVPPAFVLVMGYAEAMFMTLAAVVLLDAAAAAVVDRGGGRLPRGPDPTRRHAARGARARRGGTHARSGGGRRRSLAPVAGSLAYLAWAAAPHARLPVSAARAAGPDAPRRLGRSVPRGRSRRRASCSPATTSSAGIHAVTARRVRAAARRAVPALAACRSRCTPRPRSSSRSAAATSTRSSATGSRRCRSCSRAPMSSPPRRRARRVLVARGRRPGRRVGPRVHRSDRAVSRVLASPVADRRWSRSACAWRTSSARSRDRAASRFPTGASASSPSECAVGDQLFYNAEANYVANGHGFNEPLRRVMHPGDEGPAGGRPPAAHRARARAGVVARRPPAALVGDRRAAARPRARAPLHDGACSARSRVAHRPARARAARACADPSRCGRARRGGHRRDLTEHLGQRRARHVGDGHRPHGRRRDAAARSRCWDRPTLWRAAVLGALCGLAALARAEFDPARAAARDRRRACVRREPWPTGARSRSPASWHRGPRGRAVGRVQPRALPRPARSSRRTTASRCSARTATTVYYGAGIGLIVPRGLPREPSPPGDQSQVVEPLPAPGVRLHRARTRDACRSWCSRASGGRGACSGRGDMVAYNVGEGPREVGDAPRPGRVLPDADRSRSRGAVVLWRRRRARRAVGPRRARDRGHDRRRRHLRADALPGRGRAVARGARRGRRSSRVSASGSRTGDRAARSRAVRR